MTAPSPQKLARLICSRDPSFGEPLDCGCTSGKSARLVCPEHAQQEPVQSDGTHLPVGRVQARINVLEAEVDALCAVLAAARDVLRLHADAGARAGAAAADIDRLLNPPATQEVSP
jgi:hypothetical protein